MVLKRKIIFTGGVIVALAGTTSGILVPLLTKKTTSSGGKEIKSYQSLIAKIVAASDEQAAKDRTMELYGLEVKNDDVINHLASEMKMQYKRAIVLGKYIFKNKDKYKINIYQGRDINALKQLLFVFKLKSNENVSQVDKDTDWILNKIDSKQDEFAFLYTIFKNKFVSGEFKQGKQTNVPNDFVTNFKTKEYKILELFSAFKVANPDQNNFPKYNMASDSDADAIQAITKYIVSLVDDTTILASDLNDYIQFKTDKSSVFGNTALGTVTFNYKTYSVTKNINFIFVKKYRISIKSGLEIKMADEVEASDIQFVGTNPAGVSIQSISTSTKKPDGSVVKVTFKAVKGTDLLIASQELSGFKSYKQKAWEIVKTMTNAHFNSIASLGVLPSAYSDKRAILDLIYNKIEIAIADAFEQKVKDSISIDNINLKSNDDDGSLVISINITNNSKSETKEFTILGFLTQAEVDVASVKAQIEEIRGMKKTVSTKIPKVSTSMIFDAAALSSLGKGGIFLDDIKNTTLTYTHKGIDHDGNLTITVKIVKGAVQAEATFIIAIAGIDVAKANALLQTVTDKTVKIFPTKLKQVANGVAPKGDDINAPIQTGFSFIFKSATNVDALGKSIVIYEVDVEPVVNGTTLREISFIVSGFQTAAEKKLVDDRNAVMSVGSAISNGASRITKIVSDMIPAVLDPQTFNAKVLRALGTGGTFPKDIKGTTLTYTHKGINNDGDLIVIVKITRGEVSTSITFKIDVSGIDDGVKGAFQITKTTSVPISPVFNPQTFDAAALESLGTGATFPKNIYGTTLTYTHRGIDYDGLLAVTIKIAKGSASATVIFTVNVSGIDQAKANAKIQAVTTKTVETLPTKLKQAANGIIPIEEDISSPTQNGFSFVFKEATQVNKQGESIVTYTVNVDPLVDKTITKDVQFVVSGFEIASKK